MLETHNILETLRIYEMPNILETHIFLVDA